ncbi:hypothetical protein BDF19DRAFT_156933 [Syncephalis fuscata]|nr:hypothetical protein BDF19DRAFT_156933 [Syncephalis fuscata]
MPGINKLWQMQKLHHQQQAAVAVKLLEFTTTTQLFYEFPRDTPYTDIQLRDTANDDQLISTHRVLLHLRCPDTLKSLNLRQMNTYLRDVPLLLLPGALDNALSWVYSGTPQPAINNNSFIDLRELFAFLGYTPGLIAIKEFFQKLTSFAAWQIIHQTVKRGNLPHTSFKALESICTKNLDWLPYYRNELPALRPIVQRLVLTELKSRKCQTDWYIRQHIMTLVHLWYPQYRRSPDAWQRALTAMGLAGEITHDTTSTQEERELESLYAICLHELSLEGLNTMLYDESVPIGPVLRAIAYRSQQFDDCIPQLDLS